MTTNVFTVPGKLYDGKSPESKEACLHITNEEIVLEFDLAKKSYLINQLLVSPRAGETDRFITLPDGGQFHCKNQEIIDQLPQQLPSEGIIWWLEQHLAVTVSSIVIVIVSLALGNIFGLPLAANKVAEKIPAQTEIVLGDTILEWMDKKDFLTPSERPENQKNALTNDFAELHKNLMMSDNIRLEFRSSKILGANAIALPGGRIVITDQLIELAYDNDEILAVLAHEAGHVEERHSLRNILQNSMVTLVIASIAGDIGSMGSSATAVPALFLQSKYSREFESSADDFALRLLQQNDIDPNVFANILERLEQQSPKGMNYQFSFLSSHPLTTERIKKIRDYQ